MPGLFTALFDMLILGGILTWFGCLFVTCTLLEEKNRSPLGEFIAYVFMPLPALIYAAACPASRRSKRWQRSRRQPALTTALTGMR